MNIERPNLVLYHGDCIDGFTAAWAVNRILKDPAISYLPVLHGRPPPAVRGRRVLLLDFAYPMDTLLRMAVNAEMLQVLDHHKTSQADLAGLPFAYFDMDRSGAGLAWDLLSGDPSTRPWLVDYVEDRDLWRFALRCSKEVNAWIGAQCRDSFAAWDRLLEAGRETAIGSGQAVLVTLDRYVAEMSLQARNVRFCGYTVPVVNAPYINTSELVGHLAETATFAMGWFQDNTGMYRYSLRSRGDDSVDVSEIAKRFGGGGHRNAAGFQSKKGIDELSVLT
jgi:hypothetical protein